MSTGRSSILSLYKQMLRESEKFEAYNFRTYAIRRIRDAFRENKKISDMNIIKDKLDYGNKNLEIIRRQVIIGHLFSSDKLVIEHEASKDHE